MFVHFFFNFFYCRWNTLSANDQDEAFPYVAPNFVAKICPDNDSQGYCHQKMLDYMNADVEVSD